MVAEQGWSPERGSREQIADVHASQVVEHIIEVPKMAEQILDVPVLESVEQSVKLPSTVSDDRIQQRTAEHITVTSVLQDVKEMVEVSGVFQKDRIQQRFVEQADETPDISRAVKIVERPVTQTQQAVNTNVQHVVNAVEVERHIIQDKINQETKRIETSLLYFNDKVVDIPVVAQKQISMILTVQKNIEISQLQVEDVPVVVVAQVPQVPVEMKTVETSQLQPVEQVPQVHVEMKTVEIPQLQVKAVDVPVVLVILVSQVQVVKKTVEDPQFEIIEKTVENPVIDACLTCDAKCMVACESCVKDNMFMVPGEITVAGKMDIPRETLLQNKIFRVIKKTLVKKCLEMTRGSFVQGGAGTALSGNGSKRQQHTQGARQAAQKRESEVKQRGEQGREEREEGRKGQRGRDQEGRKEERGAEEAESVEKDVTGWTEVTRKRKKIVQIFVKVDGGKTSTMEMEMSDKVDDIVKKISISDQDVYVTSEGKSTSRR